MYWGLKLFLPRCRILLFLFNLVAFSSPRNNTLFSPNNKNTNIKYFLKTLLSLLHRSFWHMDFRDSRHNALDESVEDTAQAQYQQNAHAQ